MNHDKKRALIERYLKAYNTFDIDDMLAVIHPDVSQPLMAFLHHLICGASRPRHYVTVNLSRCIPDAFLRPRHTNGNRLGVYGTAADVYISNYALKKYVGTAEGMSSVEII